MDTFEIGFAMLIGMVMVGLILYQHLKLKDVESKVEELQQQVEYFQEWDTFLREQWNSRSRLRIVMHPDRAADKKKIIHDSLLCR
jgi:hypothetical protein